ncbi:putative nucleotidyltransferase with HDIG domain [Desulfoprunum benzoelyticum]|uniref:Putative nucleotidyltransferase with HDIG domain n=1 Tax=Desulfoprunum benzoelyticum TaxID=1506996 RepID=A0A840UUM9_9BACT|nr:HD domain-containing protein [Desulfoprunum benzoelyticum]MBB5348513.1 putative nucleotidyltransferase with HDIG domain [Desulfoprunum benzoelyticum]
MNIPTIAQCVAYMDDFAMYANIRDHSFMVAKAAAALLEGLKRADRVDSPLPPDDLVIAGALLHDIAKTLCLKENCRHAEVGREICRDLGHPEIGEIVAEHVVLSDFSLDRYRRGAFTAGELVYYADKRVRHDVVVPLASRLDYILERYGNNDPEREHMIATNFRRCRELETHLFEYLDYRPEDLSRFIPATLATARKEPGYTSL